MMMLASPVSFHGIKCISSEYCYELSYMKFADVLEFAFLWLRAGY